MSIDRNAQNAARIRRNWQRGTHGGFTSSIATTAPITGGASISLTLAAAGGLTTSSSALTIKLDTTTPCLSLSAAGLTWSVNSTGGLQRTSTGGAILLPASSGLQTAAGGLSVLPSDNSLLVNASGVKVQLDGTGGIASTVSGLRMSAFQTVVSSLPNTDGGVEYQSQSGNVYTQMKGLLGSLSMTIVASGVASTAVANTTTPTNFNNSTSSIPANFLTVGRGFRLRAFGVWSTVDATPTLTVEGVYGGVSIGGMVMTPTVAVTSKRWYVDITFILATTGSSGTGRSAGLAAYENPGTLVMTMAAGVGTATVNTTTSNTLAVRATWSIANAANTTVLNEVHWEAL